MVTIKKEWFVKPIVFAIFGVISIICGIFLIRNESFYYGALCFNIGIALFTACLGLQASKINKKIAYSSFQETLWEFEDRRLTILDKIYRIRDKQNLGMYQESHGISELKLDQADVRRYASFSIWKCCSYFRGSMDFKEYLRRRHRNDLIDHVNLFFKEIAGVKKVYGLKLTDGYKNNLEYMFDKVSKFDVYEKNETRKRDLRNNLAFLQCDC